jgi:nitrilase
VADLHVLEDLGQRQHRRARKPRGREQRCQQQHPAAEGQPPVQGDHAPDVSRVPVAEVVEHLIVQLPELAPDLLDLLRVRRSSGDLAAIATVVPLWVRIEPMASFPTVRVAAIQATPVILDAGGCIDKAARLLHEAADDGAQLAVLPECFVPLYPSNAWARSAAGFAGWDEFWERMWENSVDVPGPAIDRLSAVCRERNLYCAIGVNERESERPGTLYNTVVYLGPEGVLGRHRKLMPTQHERLFHGVGAGDDLGVVTAAAARVGGLICWENRMPLARYAVYRGGPQIWVAPTADDSDGWLASMRHIAIESGAFVVSAPQFIPASAFPSDFPVPLPPDTDVFGRGGAAIIEPTWGEVIAGPVYGQETILMADCDLRRGLHAKRWFDSVGHYGREDLLFHAPEPRAGPGDGGAGDGGAGDGVRSPESVTGRPPPARTPELT